jgi:CrcB protein
MPGAAVTIRDLVWIFVGGGFGATSRVLLAGAVDRLLDARLPHAGVLAANLIGCLLIGFFAAVLPPGTTRNAVIGGVLGGFTTYSAFALFKVELIGDGRWGILGIQLLGHVVGGILLVMLGAWVARVSGLGAAA